YRLPRIRRRSREASAGTILWEWIDAYSCHASVGNLNLGGGPESGLLWTRAAQARGWPRPQPMTTAPRLRDRPVGYASRTQPASPARPAPSRALRSRLALTR